MNANKREFIILWIAASAVFGQTQGDHSHFEVASIRPVDSQVAISYAGPATGDLGRFVTSRTTLRQLIAGAYPDEYGHFGEGISGPLWIENEYSVEATIPPGSTAKDIPRMLQNLVAERFGLRFHEENRDVQGFDLTIGQKGFKLTRSTVKPNSSIFTGPGTWGSSWDHELGLIRTSFHQCSMKQLGNMLSSTYGELSVPVSDRTEIKGVFDFHVTLPIPSYTGPPGNVVMRSPSARMRPPDSPAASVADLRGLSGSLEKQTGLRLKAVKLTLRTMVIDNVAKVPTEN